jgi:hypothetical protein
VASKADETLSEAEIARRRDEAIRRALNTPPKPHKDGDGDAQAHRKKQIKRATRSKPKDA